MTPDRLWPYVSVVVPVRNGERTIVECLRSLVRVDYPSERREILVVDNGSTDATAELVARFPVRALHERRPGPSRARNAGIRASRGVVLAFTDADCVVTQGWLRAIVQALDAPGVDGVAGEIVAYPPETPAERFAARTRHLSPQRYLNRPVLPFAVFANLAFRRNVFDRVGLLDESFSWGESTDFCWRVFRGTGSPVRYAPRAVVFHRHRRTVWELLRQRWGYGRGHALLHIKYRADVPWGWRQAVATYGDLGRTAWRLAVAALRAPMRAGRSDELEFCCLDLLRKVAERLGFAREALGRGYVPF